MHAHISMIMIITIFRSAGDDDDDAHLPFQNSGYVYFSLSGASELELAKEATKQSQR